MTKATKAELIKASASKIKTREDALRFLRNKEVLLEEEEVTVGALAMALLYLVRGPILAPDLLVDGMRAVALCMEGVGKETAVRAAVKESKEAIKELVGDARKMVEGMMAEATQVLKDVKAAAVHDAAVRETSSGVDRNRGLGG
jgi:hypothetical protein